MGIALWLVAGSVACALARIVPFGPKPRWPADLLLALTVAFVFGVIATAMDFGGWREPDWRAALFALFAAFLAAGLLRLTMMRKPGGPA